MRAFGTAVRAGAGLLGLWALTGWGWSGALAASTDSKPDKAGQLAQGAEIFHREWLPNDPRGHGGDGLGPVYNDTSCIACHNAGGAGGAGPVSKNIDILNASRNRVGAGNTVVITNFAAPTSNTVVTATPPAQAVARPSPPNLDALIGFHAGFRDGRTVVLHRFGADPNYEAWRRGALSGNVNAFLGMVQQASPMQVDFMLPGTNPSQPQPLPTVTAGDPPVLIQPVSGPAPAQALVEVQDTDVQQALRQMKAAFAQRPQVAQNPMAAPTPSAEDRALMQLQQVRMAVLNGNANVQQAGQTLQLGEFVVTRSQRNPTPLFGIGQIDAIPDSVLEAAAARRFAEFPEILGRVSRLKDGRIGRLGWKGQTASSEDFVLTACAVELGLEVPGHNQAIVPQAPKYKASGLDLTAEECAALVAYVRELPRPAERAASSPEEKTILAAGKAAFASVGCASCHSPNLGEVEGIYSDLLLHDMGAEMAESGSYNGSGDDSDDSEPLSPLVDASQPQSGPKPAAPKLGASKQEWKTPPLWGVRDSGPYMHDGRAQTLEQAIAAHGGQGQPSAQRFFKLSPRDRLQVEAFLKSLTAPVQLARAGN